MLTKLAKYSRQVQNKDIELTDRYLVNTPFHSTYWSRRRLSAAITSRAKDAAGLLLDIGCGIKPYEKSFAPYVDKYIGIEYSPESGFAGNKADVYGDAAFLPIASASVDTILCTEVLEHVSHPEQVVAEFARVMRPNGLVITTAPFFYPIHDEYDFFRYTDKGVAALMKRHGFSIEEIRPLSGSGVSLALMINLYWYNIGFIWTKWLYPIGIILRPLLLVLVFIINMLGWLFDQVIPSSYMSFNHLTVARYTANAR